MNLSKQYFCKQHNIVASVNKHLLHVSMFSDSTALSVWNTPSKQFEVITESPQITISIESMKFALAGKKNAATIVYDCTGMPGI